MSDKTSIEAVPAMPTDSPSPAAAVTELKVPFVPDSTATFWAASTVASVGDIGLGVLGDDVDVERRADSDVGTAADPAGPVGDRHRVGRRHRHPLVGVGARVSRRAGQGIEQDVIVDIGSRRLVDHVDDE